MQGFSKLGVGGFKFGTWLLEVNGEPGKEDMNFDINKPEEGSHTYVHVTPAFGPVCEPGCKVTYWLAAMDKGLITEMPEKAFPVKETTRGLV